MDVIKAEECTCKLECSDPDVKHEEIEAIETTRLGALDVFSSVTQDENIDPVDPGLIVIKPDYVESQIESTKFCNKETGSNSSKTSHTEGNIAGRNAERNLKTGVSVDTNLYCDKLIPFYERGMTNYSKSDPHAQQLFGQAVLQTGLKEEELKRWIDNYKRLLKRKDLKLSGRQEKRAQRCPKKKKRGLDLFLQEQLRAVDENITGRETSTERMSVAARQWRELSDDQRKQYRDRAEVIPAPAPHSTCSKTALKRLEKEVAKLEEGGALGVLMLVVHKDGNLSCLGTDNARKWWSEQAKAKFGFISACKGQEITTPDDVNLELRKRIQVLFNKKYREATKNQSAKCSYVLVNQGKVVAVGMPDGISLKRPGGYGRHTMERILSKQDDISFIVDDGSDEASCPQDTDDSDPEIVTSDATILHPELPAQDCRQQGAGVQRVDEDADVRPATENSTCTSTVEVCTETGTDGTRLNKDLRPPAKPTEDVEDVDTKDIEITEVVTWDAVKLETESTEDCGDQTVVRIGDEDADVTPVTKSTATAGALTETGKDTIGDNDVDFNPASKSMEDVDMDDKDADIKELDSVSWDVVQLDPEADLHADEEVRPDDKIVTRTVSAGRHTEAGIEEIRLRNDDNDDLRPPSKRCRRTVVDDDFDFTVYDDEEDDGMDEYDEDDSDFTLSENEDGTNELEFSDHEMDCSAQDQESNVKTGDHSNLPSIQVLTTDKNSKGNPGIKAHACLYCKQLHLNISRHLTRQHASEEDVAKILKLSKGGKERRRRWQKVVNAGDFKHNYEVLEKRKGVIIPKYCSKAAGEAPISHFVPCVHCKGMYSKSELCRHERTCSGEKKLMRKQKRKDTIGDNDDDLNPASKSMEDVDKDDKDSYIKGRYQEHFSCVVYKRYTKHPLCFCTELESVSWDVVQLGPEADLHADEEVRPDDKMATRTVSAGRHTEAGIEEIGLHIDDSDNTRPPSKRCRRTVVDDDFDFTVHDDEEDDGMDEYVEDDSDFTLSENEDDTNELQVTDHEMDCSAKSQKSNEIAGDHSNLPTIQVLTTDKNSKGKPGIKAHACLYCKQLHLNVSRHLTRQHASEEDVAKILKLSKGSKERRRRWQKLVNAGDFKHNYEVLEKRKGIIIPKYCSKAAGEAPISRFVPCVHCKGMYSKSKLYRHGPTCSGGKRLMRKQKRKHEAVINGLLMLPVDTDKQVLRNNVLIYMKDDDVKVAIENDQRIMEYGHQLFHKFGSTNKDQRRIIQKLRKLGRLLKAVEKISQNVKTIDQCLETRNWNVLIQAVQEITGHSAESGQNRVPSLALTGKLGHSLQSCANNLRNEGLNEPSETQNEIEARQRKIEKAEAFLELYKNNWNKAVSGKHQPDEAKELDDDQDHDVVVLDDEDRDENEDRCSSHGRKPNMSGKRKIHNKRKASSKRRKRRPWSSSEKAAVIEHLGVFLRTGQCPGKRSCMVALRDKRLTNRDWKSVKYFVKNLNSAEITKALKLK